MNNTINIDYMTKTYQNFLMGYQAQSRAAATGFAGLLERAAAARNTDKASAAATSGIRLGAATKEKMTREQYKQYIHDKISQIPLHSSQRLNNISIHISDEGFEAMQKDPEYEKWVLDTIKYDFSFNNPFAMMCGGSFVMHSFGATKEEYHGESWNKGFQNGKQESLLSKKTKDSFWERRMRRQKLMQEQYERQLVRKWQLQQASNQIYGGSANLLLSLLMGANGFFE